LAYEAKYTIVVPRETIVVQKISKLLSSMHAIKIG
jgi:hypothetical protein